MAERTKEETHPFRPGETLYEWLKEKCPQEWKMAVEGGCARMFVERGQCRSRVVFAGLEIPDDVQNLDDWGGFDRSTGDAGLRLLFDGDMSEILDEE